MERTLQDKSQLRQSDTGNSGNGQPNAGTHDNGQGSVDTRIVDQSVLPASNKKTDEEIRSEKVAAAEQHARQHLLSLGLVSESPTEKEYFQQVVDSQLSERSHQPDARRVIDAQEFTFLRPAKNWTI